MCPFGWKSVHPLRLVVIFDNGKNLVSFCFLILGPSVIDDVVFLLPEPYGMMRTMPATAIYRSILMDHLLSGCWSRLWQRERYYPFHHPLWKFFLILPFDLLPFVILIALFHVLTGFWWFFKGSFQEISITDSDSDGDICPSNICSSDIWPYQEYLSCYWPDFDET